LKIAVCGICRNEVNYVEEWVAYYKVAGFDSVYIYDNVSDDGTSELLSALDHVGEITRVHWPRREGIPPQRDAYGHFLERFSSDYDYVLICDLDEFLVVENSTIKDLLLEAESKFGNVGAIAIPWRIFGSAGHEIETEGLVIDRFKKCDAKPSVVVKTIFCPKNTYNMRTHICDLLSGVYLDNTLAIADWNQQMPIKLRSSSLGRALVHHYYTKSRQEWDRRRSLPKADRANIELKNSAEFDKYHQQAHESYAAASLAPTVTNKIKESKSKLLKLSDSIGQAQINLISVNKDWIFGVIHGVGFGSSVSLRVVNSENKETMVSTKPTASDVHVFTIKTKWRDTFSDSFSVSIVGALSSKKFTKTDWPDAETSIELLVRYCPDAEEHVFSIFISMLENRPSEKVLTLMSNLAFAKNKNMKQFVTALTNHVRDPVGGYLSVFVNSCTSDFVKQVADPANKKRKYIVDALSTKR
jgi:hypothetical protein